MHDWNVIVTAGSDQQRACLAALQARGRFQRFHFKGVFPGHVENLKEFLERAQRAYERQESWMQTVSRILPLEGTFEFTPATFEEDLKTAVKPFVQRMSSGTFYVRLERRGFKGTIVSPPIERALDDHLVALGAQEGKVFEVTFEDPDYIVMIETIGNFCGVTLLSREFRTRYPFVKVP
jgi:tRNA(Ser,Leu) C12 N-acetylase TAN1